MRWTTPRHASATGPASASSLGVSSGALPLGAATPARRSCSTMAEAPASRWRTTTGPCLLSRHRTDRSSPRSNATSSSRGSSRPRWSAVFSTARASTSRVRTLTAACSSRRSRPSTTGLGALTASTRHSFLERRRTCASSSPSDDGKSPNSRCCNSSACSTRSRGKGGSVSCRTTTSGPPTAATTGSPSTRAAASAAWIARADAAPSPLAAIGAVPVAVMRAFLKLPSRTSTRTTLALMSRPMARCLRKVFTKTLPTPLNVVPFRADNRHKRSRGRSGGSRHEAEIPWRLVELGDRPGSREIKLLCGYEARDLHGAGSSGYVELARESGVGCKERGEDVARAACPELDVAGGEHAEEVIRRIGVAARIAARAAPGPCLVDGGIRQDARVDRERRCAGGVVGDDDNLALVIHVVVRHRVYRRCLQRGRGGRNGIGAVRARRARRIEEAPVTDAVDDRGIAQKRNRGRLSWRIRALSAGPDVAPRVRGRRTIEAPLRWAASALTSGPGSAAVHAGQGVLWRGIPAGATPGLRPADARAVRSDLDLAFLDLEHGSEGIDRGVIRVLPRNPIVQARVETVVVVLYPAVAAEVRRHAPGPGTLHELEGARDAGAAAKCSTRRPPDRERGVRLVGGHDRRCVDLDDVGGGSGDRGQAPTGPELRLQLVGGRVGVRSDTHRVGAARESLVQH